MSIMIASVRVAGVTWGRCESQEPINRFEEGSRFHGMGGTHAPREKTAAPESLSTPAATVLYVAACNLRLIQWISLKPYRPSLSPFGQQHHNRHLLCTVQDGVLAELAPNIFHYARQITPGRCVNGEVNITSEWYRCPNYLL
ncbi:uncharacterized protein H6S33_003057 [Morchella sextelata]|uniref:uncharacterized protein n=1 Tax=Morchella sextelata TaxID=1174677 RepID=UPI001D043EBB|nr:uncharacterized protein H6S33_003057 [Morchella sextelata]KAH0607069.1 hypothetical protein H6S33_003057 [Morchella sextelata]